MLSRPLMLALSSVFLASFAIAAVSRIPPKASTQVHHHVPFKRSDDVCGFSGNPDLYGLGIRLGIYSQWISGLIIYAWYPEGHNSLAEAYLVFLVAVDIAIIVITARADPTYAVEILILTYMIFGGLFTITSIGVREHHRRRLRTRGSVIQIIVASIILASVSIYCSWFWLHGLHHNFLKTPCGTFGFLFAKVSLYSPPIFKFFAFLSIIFAYTYGATVLFLLIVSILIVLRVNAARKYWKPVIRSLGPQPETLPRAGDDLDGLPSSKKYKEIAIRLSAKSASPLSLVYSIIGIELTLHWNSIRDVYTINTTGQLIPFVIGLAGLAKVTYEPLKRRYKKIHASPPPSRAASEKISAQRMARQADEANRRLQYLDLCTDVNQSTFHSSNSLKDLC